MKPFKNRESAGQLLTEKLKEMTWENATILALPRGGVPIAWEIAKALNLPWDVLLVKKIGAPDQPELAVGAVSEDEHPIWNLEIISFLGLQKSELRKLVEETHKKILAQTKLWRRDKPPLDVKGKAVIVVDDGLATGMTMKASVEFLRRRGASRIVVAVPVASRSAQELLKSDVDEIVVLLTPEPFFSVGQWYEDFTQVTDEVVTRLLAGAISEEESVTSVKIPAPPVYLLGDLVVPRSPKTWVQYTPYIIFIC